MGLAIAACIPVLLAAVLSRQTLAHSDCYTTNKYLLMRARFIQSPPPRFILKKLVEAYPTVTDSPVKAPIINRTKNTR